MFILFVNMYNYLKQKIKKNVLREESLSEKKSLPQYSNNIYHPNMYNFIYYQENLPKTLNKYILLMYELYNKDDVNISAFFNKYRLYSIKEAYELYSNYVTCNIYNVFDIGYISRLYTCKTLVCNLDTGLLYYRIDTIDNKDNKDNIDNIRKCKHPTYQFTYLEWFQKLDN